MASARQSIKSLLGLTTALLLFGSLTACEDRQAEQVGVAPEVEEEIVAEQPGPGVLTEKADDNIRSYIYYPTGEEDTSYLLIEKIAPATVRAGQQYQYTIQVTNLSKTPLSGVAVREELPGGFDIQQAQPMAQFQPANQQQGGQPMMMSAQQPQQQQNQQQPQAQQPQNQQQQQMQAVWRLGELQPGQKQTINVTAIANTPGEQAACVQVDFQPTLCAVTNVINPQIALAKQGPDVVDICEPITYTYAVRNTGTGTAQNVRIQDPLPEGFTTEDGKQDLQIDVGDLQAGESKDFKVRLLATQAGQFASRAQAISANDSAFSQNVSTQVIVPDLEVSIDAPEWEYVDQRVNYRVTVSNRGEAVARGTVLQITAPETVNPMLRPNIEGEALEAARRGQYAIGDLQPGASRTVQLAYRARQGGEIQLAAVARAVCERAPEEAVLARSAAQTLIATIPALQLEMVDSADPVRVGNTTIYTIALRNEGSGPDNNIRLTATLPQGMQFVNGAGTTNVQAQGNQITFAPLQTLPPGEVATWRIEAGVAQPAQPGQQSQFEVQVQSESLTRPLIEREATNLIGQ